MSECKLCGHNSWLLNQYDECPSCLGWEKDTEGQYYLNDQENAEGDQ